MSALQKFVPLVTGLCVGGKNEVILVLLFVASRS